MCLPASAKSGAVVAWLMLSALASPSVLLPVVSEVENVPESLACEVTKRSIVAHKSVCTLGIIIQQIGQHISITHT